MIIKEINLWYKDHICERNGRFYEDIIQQNNFLTILAFYEKEEHRAFVSIIKRKLT